MTALCPFSCGSTGSGTGCAPSRNDLEELRAGRWVLGKVQTRLLLSLYGVGHVLPGSGGCIRIIELSIYFHSLGTILLSPEEGASFPHLLRGAPRASSGAVAPPLA